MMQSLPVLFIQYQVLSNTYGCYCIMRSSESTHTHTTRSRRLSTWNTAKRGKRNYSHSPSLPSISSCTPPPCPPSPLPPPPRTVALSFHLVHCLLLLINPLLNLLLNNPHSSLHEQESTISQTLALTVVHLPRTRHASSSSLRSQQCRKH
jgi:hypothetical protein